MIIHRKDMKTELKEKMRGGDGVTKLVHFVDAANEKNARLIAEITLEKGCSIGTHDHVNETEYYLIISGTGRVNDNGVDVPVGPGDSVITGNGASHNITNTGSTPLVFHAVIVTYDK